MQTNEGLLETLLGAGDSYFPSVPCMYNGRAFVMESGELVQDPRLGIYLVKILHFLTAL